ncbi:hypothetical protein N9D35_08325 [Gammaproteobacteria bacterium]|nr:hypothetical protein [Gammaproteobacteria bacterium]
MNPSNESGPVEAQLSIKAQSGAQNSNLIDGKIFEKLTVYTSIFSSYSGCPLAGYHTATSLQ